MIDNLTEAIAHCHEKAEEIRKANEEMPNGCKLSEDLCECASEHEQLASWLEELKERREADRWIPVSEKLPDEYGNYLVFTSDNDIDIGTFNPRFDDSWSLCDANGFYWARQKGIKITHWKPLPKAPESEEQ